jgi:hypothetical protein
MVYQKEQEMKSNDPNSIRRRRGKREAAPNRRDLFAKRNKGIDSRNKYDKEARESKSAASQSALQAKSALYNQIGTVLLFDPFFVKLLNSHVLQCRARLARVVLDSLLISSGRSQKRETSLLVVSIERTM